MLISITMTMTMVLVGTTINVVYNGQDYSSVMDNANNVNVAENYQWSNEKGNTIYFKLKIIEQIFLKNYKVHITNLLKTTAKVLKMARKKIQRECKIVFPDN